MTDQTKYTDRELLFMAARAAGITLVHWSDMARAFETTTGKYWNPLIYDDDALRLAVARHMGVKSNGPGAHQDPNCTIILFDAADCPRRLCRPHDGDPAAATRRAIVLAAVEIGSAA